MEASPIVLVRSWVGGSLDVWEGSIEITDTPQTALMKVTKRIKEDQPENEYRLSGSSLDVVQHRMNKDHPLIGLLFDGELVSWGDTMITPFINGGQYFIMGDTVEAITAHIESR